MNYEAHVRKFEKGHGFGRFRTKTIPNVCAIQFSFIMNLMRHLICDSPHAVFRNKFPSKKAKKRQRRSKPQCIWNVLLWLAKDYKPFFRKPRGNGHTLMLCHSLAFALSCFSRTLSFSHFLTHSQSLPHTHDHTPSISDLHSRTRSCAERSPKLVPWSIFTRQTHQVWSKK